MMPTRLRDDLAHIFSDAAAAGPVREQAERARCVARPDARWLAELGAAAALGAYRTLALMLKAEFEADQVQHPSQPTGERTLTWRPWEQPARYHGMLSGCADPPDLEATEVLLWEQTALGCERISAAQVAALATHHAREARMLQDANSSERSEFLADKRAWLQNEHVLGELIDREKRLLDDIVHVRLAFLATYRDYPALVEAAHALARERYRWFLNDASMTDTEIDARLVSDLETQNACSRPELEPALREVLRDDLAGLRHDLASARTIERLARADLLVPADAASLERAALLFRRLARRIHPDMLRCHPQFAEISPRNLQRLEEIWRVAASLHRRRVSLDCRSLSEHITRLECFLGEVERILAHVDCFNPQYIVAGRSLAECRDYVQRASAAAAGALHALRSEIALLSLDSLVHEQRRLLGLSEDERAAESRRMRVQAAAWLDETRHLVHAMRLRAEEEALADARQMRGARP